MKKLLAILLTLALVLSFAACGKTETKEDTAGKEVVENSSEEVIPVLLHSEISTMTESKSTSLMALSKKTKKKICLKK